MAIYSFRSGREIVEIMCEPIMDFNIRINNPKLKTGNKFVSIAMLIGEDGAKELREKLTNIYDDYIINEFKRMNYTFVKKNVT